MLDVAAVNVVKSAIGFLALGGNLGFTVDVSDDELDKRPVIAKLDMHS